MPSSILLEVSHPSAAPGPIEGFRFMWAFYVKGYNPDAHCQPSFIGSRAPNFCTPTAQSGRSVVLDRMDRFPYVYICGVSSAPRHERGQKNLHFPLRYAEGKVAEASTHNGYRFRAVNAECLAIPELPEGWDGKPREHVRCKNFQFAVAYFGAARI